MKRRWRKHWRCSMWSTPMPSKAPVPSNLVSSSKLVVFSTNALLLKLEAQWRTQFRSQTGRLLMDTSEEEAHASSSQNCARTVSPDTSTGVPLVERNFWNVMKDIKRIFVGHVSHSNHPDDSFMCA